MRALRAQLRRDQSAETGDPTPTASLGSFRRNEICVSPVRTCAMTCCVLRRDRVTSAAAAALSASVLQQSQGAQETQHSKTQWSSGELRNSDGGKTETQQRDHSAHDRLTAGLEGQDTGFKSNCDVQKPVDAITAQHCT